MTLALTMFCRTIVMRECCCQACSYRQLLVSHPEMWAALALHCIFVPRGVSFVYLPVMISRTQGPALGQSVSTAAFGWVLADERDDERSTHCGSPRRSLFIGSLFTVRWICHRAVPTSVRLTDVPNVAWRCVPPVLAVPAIRGCCSRRTKPSR